VVPHTVRRFLRGASFLAAFGAAAFVLPDNARADDNETLSSCPIGAPPGTEPNRDNLRPLIGDTAPELRFTDLDGKPRLLSELRGKPVLLDFWATWCAPCRDEFPNLRGVHEAFGEKVTVLSINLDDALRTAKSFVAKRQTEMPWSHGHVPKNLYKEAYLNYNLRGLPACFLIDANGKIVARELRGKKTKETVELFLQNKLKPADESRATIGGIVVDDAGNPIEGASIKFYVRRNDNPEKGVLGAYIFGDAKTGKDGRWSYKAFPGAHHGWLKIYHPAYAESAWRKGRGDGSVYIQSKDFRMTADFEPLYKQEYKHELVRGLDIIGIVKDETGKPIANAEVFMGSGHYGNSIPLQKTGTDGKFRFAREKGQHVWLKAAAKGFAPDLKKFTMTDKAAEVEFVLKPAKTIKGIVLDDAGKPLADATVALGKWRGGELFDGLRDGRTKANSKGQFTFKNMPEDEIEISVHHYRKGNFFREKFSIRHDKENKIVLTRAKTEFRIVKVLDAQTDKPVSGFIEANISPDGTDRDSSSSYWRMDNKVPFTVALEEKLPKDVSKLKLTVRVKGYKEKVITGLPLDNKRQDVVVKLEKNSFLKRKGEPRKPVELQILTPDGEPAAGAEVRHFATVPKQIAEEYPKKLFANKDGKVKLPPMYSWEEIEAIRRGENPDEEEGSSKVTFYTNVQPQGYLVEINHDSGYLGVFQISSETAEKPVTMQKWTKIKGKVFVGDKPVAGAKVYLGKKAFQTILAGHDISRVTDKDGAFEFTNLKAGLNYVSVELDGAASQRLVLCKRGETSEITIGGQGRPLTATVSASELSKFDGRVRFCEEIFGEKFPGVKLPTAPALYLTPILEKKNADAAETREMDFSEQSTLFYTREKEVLTRQQQAKVGEDGTIRFENVVPGKYRLVVYTLGKSDGQIEAASAPFEVTLDAGKTFDTKAQDLGVVKLEQKKIHAGASVPNFIFQDLQGEIRNSSEFAGKTWVLLLFDATSFDGYRSYSNLEANVPSISSSRDGGEKIGFLALHRGKEPKGFNKRLTNSRWIKQRVGWLTAEQEQVFSTFGFGDETPQYFLMNKDGKIIATGSSQILEWSHLKNNAALREADLTALRMESRKALETNAKK
jgi:thiol-disulfide isomerase/thioredoxin